MRSSRWVMVALAVAVCTSVSWPMSAQEAIPDPVTAFVIARDQVYAKCDLPLDAGGEIGMYWRITYARWVMASRALGLESQEQFLARLEKVSFGTLNRLSVKAQQFEVILVWAARGQVDLWWAEATLATLY